MKHKLFSSKTLVFALLIMFLTVTTQAQDEDACDPDFTDIYTILARAEVSFDADDTEGGLTALEEAHQAISIIESQCNSGSLSGDVVLNLTTEFPELDQDDLTTWYEDDVFHIENISGERLFVELLDVIAYDFTLVFDVQVVPGYVAGAEYGIAFRGAEGFFSDFYHWRISTNAKIIVYANTIHGPRGSMQSYQPRGNANDWLDTPSFDGLMNAVNHFELSCTAQTCDFSINGTQVMRTRDARLISGGFALVTDGVVHISVENMILTRLKR